MNRTPEELIAAIEQMRGYAFRYEGKRKEFYQNLYDMLATPIPRNEKYENNVKKMYFAALRALTAEIQPPTAETYDTVLEKLNSVLKEEKLDRVRIAISADDAIEDGYQIVGKLPRRGDTSNDAYDLRQSLPAKRKLTKKNQALVDKFRAELPDTPLRFRNGEPQRGQQN